MSSEVAPMTDERLIAALDAWNKQDVDLIMSFFSEDAAYYASVGPELRGRTFRGHEQVRQGVEGFIEAFPGGYFEDTRVTVCGDRGFSEWVFVCRGETGEEQRVGGCDLFEFRSGLIVVKNAFRKASSNGDR